MRLLVLGGTKFLGRAAVEAALERGHEVTLFNRGETNPGLFPEAEKLRGDRDGDLSALEGREWDAVIDPSGFVPRVVRASAELLRGSVGHYVFVSSISVYTEPYEPGFDEDAPVFEAEPKTESVDVEYAELKAACERVLEEVLPGAHASVRAGLIVGPHDPTGRFTYWPLAVRGGGRRAGAGAAGAGGAVRGRARPRRVARACGGGAHGRDVQRRSTFSAFRRPAGDVPRALPAASRESCGQTRRSSTSRESASGWRCLSGWPEPTRRSCRRMSPGLSERAWTSVRCGRPCADTLAWARQAGIPLLTPSARGSAGMDPAREADLLEAWSRRDQPPHS